MELTAAEPRRKGLVQLFLDGEPGPKIDGELFLLSRLKPGNELTEEELLSAKLALQNSMRSVQDSLSAMENAYLGQVFGGHVMSPEASAEQIMTYSREQVTEAARRLRPAAVYTLKGGAVHG